MFRILILFTKSLFLSFILFVISQMVIVGLVYCTQLAD